MIPSDFELRILFTWSLLFDIFGLITAPLANNLSQLHIIHLENLFQTISTRPGKFYYNYKGVADDLTNLDRAKLNLPMEVPLKLKVKHTVQNKYQIFPRIMIRFMCSQFSKYYPTNSFVLVHDAGDISKGNFNRAADYFIHLSSSLGIPTITWFPDKAGQYELDQSALAIRLEPTSWHIVRAIVDFMRVYNWTKISVVVTTKVPDYQIFLKELNLIQKETSSSMQDNNFEFTISQILTIRGIVIDDLNKCMVKKALCPFIQEVIVVLEKLYRKDDRVIIFHGYNYEMVTILKTVKLYLTGPRRHLKKLFGANYIWICTPPMMSIVEFLERKKTVNPDLIVINKDWRISKVDISVPGMFVFVTFNNFNSFKAKMKIAHTLWMNSLSKLTKFLFDIYKNKTKVVDHLRPLGLCKKLNSKWAYGQKLFRIMQSMTLKIKDEYIGFLNNGAINTTEMFIFNSKTKDKEMSWHKVGSWSLSSKWGKAKSKLMIDGVTWPGNEMKPPKGRPDRFRLRVVTLQEKPFVISQESQSGKCDANSINCYIRKISGPKKPVDSSVNYKNVGMNISSIYAYVRGCCSGLTMDMLSELQKDLDFDVDLFEVPDGKWGGWTPEGWNGLVKVLKDRTADMAITTFKITPNRSEQVDFSVPFQETGIAIIVALREGAISPTAFLKPYDYQSWCVILVFSVHACGAALFIYEWLSPHGLDRGNQVNPDHKFSFFRSLWLIWSMLFGAAVNADNPRGTASRFLANIWALFALVFLASYTANLAAFMIAKDDFHDLSGIKDNHLMNPESYKPPFTFATVPSGATEENILINFPKMYKHMWKYRKSTVDEGLKALKLGEINAFIYDSNVLEYRAAKDEKCKLKTVGNLFAMTGYGVGFPKNSKWLNKVNDRILEYQKNGKLRRWKRFWLTGACKKDRRLDSTNKKLGVKNFISAFILLLGGIILCSVLLMLEHTFYRYLRPHLTNIDRYGCCGLVSISMGQILTFEQSVNQTVDLMKHHKCSNAICQSRQQKSLTETNKMHERIKTLERALIIERLEKQKFKKLLDNCGVNQSDKNHVHNNSSKQKSQESGKSSSKIHSLPTMKTKSKENPNSESATCHTPTFVYECNHGGYGCNSENIDPLEMLHLANLSPSQVYRPNSQTYTANAPINTTSIKKQSTLPNNKTGQGNDGLIHEKDDPYEPSFNCNTLTFAFDDTNNNNHLISRRRSEMMEKESCL